MKPPIATLGLTCLLAAAPAVAQDAPRGAATAPIFGRRAAAPAVAPAAPGTAAAPGAAPAAPAAAPGDKADSRVFPASGNLPAPTPPDQIKAATLALPNEPIEPYLLTKDQGPFMVLAKTFRGPDAERFALALVLELRKEYGLPAYILRTKDFPNRSNIRNVPPTAPEYIRQSQLTEPEKVRSFDEAAVLVGNEKTLNDSEKLLHRVKKIKPKCLDEVPSLFSWRTGLSQAVRTTNPFVPAQNIFPGRKKDGLIAQMNAGPRSINNCPGRYTLQVAEFGGRTIYNPSDKDVRLFENSWLRKSPLVTAADDAERLAEKLSKDPDIQKAGVQPYVYHDRTSSKVMIGSFNAPNDPNAVRLRDSLLRLAVPMSDTKRVGIMIAPAPSLTDLEDPNTPFKTASRN